MKLETMDGKTAAAEQPAVTIIQAEGSGDSSSGGKKSRVTRKHVIIGVTCALVVAMVITGALVGVRFHLDSANELVTRHFVFNKDKDHRVKVDVSADVKENYVRYHVKDDDSEVWVINDFNRELQVMKVKQFEGSKCYVAILNTGDDAVPEAVLNATATDDTVETEYKYYDVSETAIKDQSMLGAHGEELCHNLDVHWMTQTCDAAAASSTEWSEKKSGRQKRVVIDTSRLRSRCRSYYVCRPSGPGWPANIR